MLNQKIKQFWRDNADSYLKAVLIHLKQQDDVLSFKLDEHQQIQLQSIIDRIYQAKFSIKVADIFIALANSLPFIAMYYLFKTTKQHNPLFIEALLSYVFEKPTKAAEDFKSRIMLVEKSQLLVRYLNVENLYALEDKLQ
ncbi:type IVB secretion system protein IcmW [Facilibium subflavum]|uniref:type IVB secretion system protein IcmW n=1 Tax=Facilibium subflavum TaxID=2219058 RepID=UPI000E64BF97|nr:hypothetical protein [Facilibium subflavum]